MSSGSGSGPMQMQEVQMKIPTADEVKQYVLELGYNIKSDAFLDHYEKIGWVHGKNRIPIKSWQACVRTWKRFAEEDKRSGTDRRDLFVPIPKESDEARKERLLKAKLCLYCKPSGVLEFDQDRNRWACKSCGIEHKELLLKVI